MGSEDRITWVPRSCGKTTTAARLAAQIDRLDEPGGAEAALSDPEPRMHHLRTSKGDVGVDLVFDLGRRRAVAVEFKSAAKVDRRDAKHLMTLRDDVGTDFLAGVVLYSGSHLVQLDDRVYGVPLCCLWS